MKAIIFDMDDTLLHLDVPWGKVGRELRELAESHGIEPGVNITYLLAESAGGAFREELYGVMEKYEANGWQGATLMPNAAEALESLKEKYALGIVTGNGIFVAEKALQKCGIKDYFQAVATREDGIKPTAKPLLLAAKQMGLSAREACYVGNSNSDMKAANAAGMKAVGYTATNTAKDLEEAGADIIINDLSELKGALE